MTAKLQATYTDFPEGTAPANPTAGHIRVYNKTGAGLKKLSSAGVESSLGLIVGTDVQAYDADLSQIAGFSHASGNLIVSNGSIWVNMAKGVDGSTLVSDSTNSNGMRYVGSLIEIQAPTELGSSQTTITFSSIPAWYQDLLLVVKARSTSTGQSVLVTFNADTGNNYSKNSSVIDNAAAETHAVNHNQTSVTCVNACVPSTGTAGYFGRLDFVIEGYAESNKTRSGYYLASQFIAAANHERSEGSWGWEDVSNTLTSIELNLDVGDFDTGTIYALYGRGIAS